MLTGGLEITGGGGGATTFFGTPLFPLLLLSVTPKDGGCVVLDSVLTRSANGERERDLDLDLVR